MDKSLKSAYGKFWQRAKSSLGIPVARALSWEILDEDEKIGLHSNYDFIFIRFYFIFRLRVCR